MDKNMKYWLIKSNTRDGENEYLNFDTFEGKEENIEGVIQGWRGFSDYRVVKLQAYQEIPKCDFDVLNNYGI